MSDETKKNGSETLQERADIVELTNSFLSVMDGLKYDAGTRHAGKSKRESPVKNICRPALPLPRDADKAYGADKNLDEEYLDGKFDAGGFKDGTSPGGEQADEKQENLSENKEKRIFYASLYLSGKPIELATFRKMLDPVNLENRLLNYAEEFNKLRLGVRIRMVSGGYQAVTDADVTGFLEKYFGERTESLSKASLETAAIIAYKQPVTKAEVEEMRGVNSAGTMKYLLDKNLIKVVGRKEVPGRPLLYAVSKYFLEYFGLNDISELPTFREWQELKQNK